jgi:hypothetical protein
VSTADASNERGPARGREGWRLPAAVFGLVLAAQLFLVAQIGTDIPFQDQWDIEGRLLYPAWRDGTWHAADLLRAHNEHRILWTRLLDLALFAANGQWDPLVQLAADAVLRAAVAAALAWMLARDAGKAGRVLVGAGVVLAYLPHIAWQNALWGFQSSVYFVLLFSLMTLALLGDPGRARLRLAGGLAAGVAALFAMGAGAFVPVVLLGLAALRAMERRRFDGAVARDAWPAFALLAVAWALRAEAPAHAALRVATAGQFFNAFGRAMAWPHTWMPVAAIVLNLPLMAAVGTRLAGTRRAAAGEDFVLLIGGWAVVAAGAMAWTRGGGDEFDAGVPSRYADFLVLLPLANTWCAVVLARAAVARGRLIARTAAAVWCGFLFIGWLGLSAQVMRGLVLPRMRDRDAPVRLAVAFQQGGDATVFAGQPKLLVPHPNPATVRAVLTDPRLRGALPPSFQPGQPVGPLSRAVRLLLGRQ